MKKEIMTLKEWVQYCQQSYKIIKEWDKKFKTWNDIQKNQFDWGKSCWGKSKIWKTIKNFRKSYYNHVAYRVGIFHCCDHRNIEQGFCTYCKTRNKKAVYGWNTFAGDFSLVFNY